MEEGCEANKNCRSLSSARVLLAIWFHPQISSYFLGLPSYVLLSDDNSKSCLEALSDGILCSYSSQFSSFIYVCLLTFLTKKWTHPDTTPVWDPTWSQYFSSIFWNMKGWLQSFRNCTIVFISALAPPLPCFPFSEPSVSNTPLLCICLKTKTQISILQIQNFSYTYFYIW